MNYEQRYIHIYSFKGVLTPERIENAFNMSFLKDVFPKYYQNLIETSSLLEKDISVEGKFRVTKQANLELVEEHKKLILRKI